MATELEERIFKAADWTEFDAKFMTAIGENCNFALELIEEAWEEM